MTTMTAAGRGDSTTALLIFAGLFVAVYVAEKVIKAVKPAADYLLGGDSASSTIGTDLYDFLNPPQPYYDPIQAEKTSNALRYDRLSRTASQYKDFNDN